ncbi:M48 family metallopeptidase [Niveibacterium umoris]|uniref:STE24 endopeptidase n=1 Tax=Niveibacterium umoris TaxID=1193620 RepID=A0A840BNX0_9RHOO|nr:M48 family metallopeptidase [Niveibacterium umoris]MBB4014690.1 STE24 endopeptidase [Niveibacterium umoris]
MQLRRLAPLVPLLALLAAPACALAAGAFDAEQATRAWLDTIPHEAKLRSDAYYEGGYWLQLVDLVFALLVAWLLLRGGLSARLRNNAERLTRYKPLQSMAYAAQYLILVTLLSLPLNAYEGYWREHAYNMSNQTLADWALDQLKGLFVSILFMAPAVAAVWGAIRRAPKTWWLWGSAIATGFLMIGMVLGPVFIAPLFNDYKPLSDPKVRSEILSLARANQVPATEVYEFDASRQTKRISANVSGFMGTERISLNDNLLKRTSPAEIRAVMGHEIGHYALNHVYKHLLTFTVLTIIGFALARWAMERLIARHGGTWGLRGSGDVAALPVLVAIFAVLGFIGTPITNTVIRTAEFEADLYGLNAAREPDGFAQAAVRLAEYRKMEPAAWEEFLFYDHPSGRTRIRTAMQWKAEHLADQPAGR